MSKEIPWMRLAARNRRRQIETWASSGANPDRLSRGQYFHHVDLPEVVWRVESIYRDAMGVEHAKLSDVAQKLDTKTLSAKVILDRSRYQPV